MTPSRWSRIFLSLLLVESISSENLANYLVSVVQHLIATSFGTPHCVFIGLATFDTSLESVLRDRKLDSVTKTVITQPIPTLLTVSSIPSEPLVIFIQAGGFSMFTAKLLLKFSPSSRVVVVYKKKMDFMAFEYLISFLFYYKTVYIDEHSQQATINNLVGKEHFRVLPRPKDLFKTSMKRNLRGKPVTYMSRRPLPGEHVMINVVKDLAAFMNTTAQRSNHTCSIEHTNVRDLCYRQHFEDNVINIDLSGYVVSEPFTCSHFECILTSIQNDGAMLVPRSPLHIVQLFVLPLKWQVWTTLVILFSLVKIIHWIQPTIFQNDPLLTAICGYESHDLHKTNRLERFTLISLITLMFFTTNAYEAKLLSLLINRPATKEIKTFADLVASGVKIKANLLQHPSIVDDPVFGQLMVNSSETIFNMDAASAHIIDRRWARLVLPMYYDRVQRLHRYRITDQSLGKIPTLFILQHRSPLREVLEYVLAVYGESGIYDYWFVAFMGLVMKQKFGRGGWLDGTDSSLSFADLTLAWQAVLFGMGVGFITFVLEGMFYLVTSHALGRKRVATIY